MSTPLAIAAVTATLRQILEVEVKKIDTNSQVTVQPPDKAFLGDNKLNLFLYRVNMNPALRNIPEIPGRTRPGETPAPPLALDLFYLLTAYGMGEPNVFADREHRLLGRAMSFLNDHPLLPRDELQLALADAQVHQQVERVRITPEPLSVEEMSKLWTTFQTQYRLSVAYQVSVLLIESEKPTRTPLPVLHIGPGNRGVLSQPDLAPPVPTLTGVDLPPWSSEPLGGLLPPQRPSAELGDMLTLRGLHLDGLDVQVVFSHPRLDQPNVVAPESGATARAIDVVIPNQPVLWPAGLYSLSVALTREGQRRETNSLPLALAPKISNRVPASTSNADFDVTVTFSPQVRPGQQVTLLFGGRELEPNAFNAPTNTLTFAVQNAEEGQYPLRLRVDGADSQLIHVTGSPPQPAFDPAQIIEVTS